MSSMTNTVDLPPMERSGPSRTHEAMIAAAQSLVPLIREHARAAELARRPSDDVITEAARLGLFDMMSPARFGGAGLDLDTFLEVGLVLGQADASHAWVINFYIEHVWILLQFPQRFHEELFSGRSHVLAPVMISPNGRATPVSGGYRLEGRWQWGTGIVHGEWVVVGAVIADEELVAGAPPRMLFLALPRDEVSVDDTWFMDGMCATGSMDVVIDAAFVAEHRSVEMAALMGSELPSAQVDASPLYTTPIAPILMLASSLPALGQARFAVDEFARQLAGRVDAMQQQKKQADRSSSQARLASAALDVDAAEALMRSVVADVMRQRSTADDRSRMRWAASIAHVVSICQRAIAQVCEAAGASAHRQDNPLQRVRRDVSTIACHRVLDLDDRHRSYGRVLLGLPSESYFH